MMETPEDRDGIIARYMNGPALLDDALAGLQDNDLDMPPPGGGWTIRQIVHHIVDGDDIWKIFIKAALGNEQAELTLDWYWALPQEDWADHWAYASRAIDVSLALLKANRSHVLQILEQIPGGWNRSFALRKSDGKIERLPVGASVEIQAGHLEHHVKRILAIRSESGSA